LKAPLDTQRTICTPVGALETGPAGLRPNPFSRIRAGPAGGRASPQRGPCPNTPSSSRIRLTALLG
jgi:hypothetical protein